LRLDKILVIIAKFAFIGDRTGRCLGGRVLHSRPIRTVLRWQILAIAGIAMFAAAWGGWHAAVSAVLGGLINVAGTVVFALVVGLNKSSSAWSTLSTMLRAEASKIASIVLLLWLALTTYKDMVPVAFFTTFVVTVILSSMAFFVRD
jgi:ATP synthase protein I